MLDRWQCLGEQVAQWNATLIAVSKYAPDAAVEVLMDVGARDFGESRPQQLRDRARRWPHCRWHMIGSLQRNKAKYVGRYAASWLSVESLAQAEMVAKHVTDRVLPVMIQVNIAAEAQQHGVLEAAVPALYSQLSALNALRVKGLMAMVPRDKAADDCFDRMQRLKQVPGAASLADLCMGMSHDYPQALARGATMVRIGSALFAELDVREDRSGV
ncbi:MAG: YggS family pyridoxal phosphate-dependent enzyme [Mariprofundales bacterium]